MNAKRRALAAVRHCLLVLISIAMLVRFYRVLKTSISGDTIFAFPLHLLPGNPNLFSYVDVWYLIPFPRYLLNSVIVSALAIGGTLVLNALAGYALTRNFPGRRAATLLLLSCMMIAFQATVIPACLITAKLGLLNSYLGLALPLLSTIICIFDFKASFEAVPPSLVEAARIDGLGDLRILWRVLLPLSRAALAVNVILAFTWSWNNFLWPLIITRTVAMQKLPLGLARYLSYTENTTSALYAFVVRMLAPGIVVFLMAQKDFIRGLTSGAAKG